eukprot:s3160_g1.t1
MRVSHVKDDESKDKELNVEMHSVQTTLAKMQSRPPVEVPHSFRDPNLAIGIASVCAYPAENPLPRYAASNHRAYALRHGYRYRLETQQVSPERPPAWGKVRLLQRLLEEEPDVDWWLWFDCDTFFMNMTVTLESILQRYGGGDSNVHFLAAEDAAMLNTGAFLLRRSIWSRDFLRRVWGTQDSVWIKHPWWENAAIIWDLLRGLSERFRDGGDDMSRVYPAEVRIVPQFELNSYHPATAQSLHDAWVPGKFVLAFNGVLSNTSPKVVRTLYGYYYEIACELNRIPVSKEDGGCLEPEEPLPWLKKKRNHAVDLSAGFYGGYGRGGPVGVRPPPVPPRPPAAVTPEAEVGHAVGGTDGAGFQGWRWLRWGAHFGEDP